MTRAERLAAMLAPLRAAAKPMPSTIPARRIQRTQRTPSETPRRLPRVEWRTAVMNAADEDVGSPSYLTLLLCARYRAWIVEAWDETDPSGSPHYLQDYEIYHFDSAEPAKISAPRGFRFIEPVPEVVEPGQIIEMERLPRSFARRLLDMFGVHS